MATQTTTTAGQRASPVDSAESIEANGVSSRRLKKREIDRRCQRQARERTKTRIAYLEGLVEDFQRQDANGQVATLIKQLQEVESERDVMAKALKDIQKAMDTHKPLRLTDVANIHVASQTHSQDAEVECKPSVGSLQVLGDASVSFKPEPDDIQEVNPNPQFDLANFSSTHNQHLPPQDMMFAPEIVRLDSDSPRSTTQAVVQVKTTSETNPMPSRWANNYASPRQTCSCYSCPDRRPAQQQQQHRSTASQVKTWRGNYWRFANEVLSERFEWTEEVQPANDAITDDVPIRALLEGWDAVAKRGPLHPSWQILRRIDETLFTKCGPTERLAIMRAMHTLLQFHTDSSSDRYARLPPWYMRRPSQKIAHSYAIDYFAWPGLRERFIFNEHDYCGNDFWRLFCSSLRILWPYEFRDCYTREIETGLYKVSPMFDQRLGDIKSWTMGPDIFQRFPELCSDMPSFNTIPVGPSSAADKRPKGHSRQLLPVAVASPKTVQTMSRVVVEEDEEEDPEVEEIEPRAAAGCHFVPIQSSHLHGQPLRMSPQQQQQQQEQSQMSYVTDASYPAQHLPPNLNPHSYNAADFNSIMALDGFPYGTMSESEFAGVYHSEVPDGMYSNMDFLDERNQDFHLHPSQFAGGRFALSRSGQV